MKIISVDGLFCSGKTTISQKLWARLLETYPTQPVMYFHAPLENDNSAIWDMMNRNCMGKGWYIIDEYLAQHWMKYRQIVTTTIKPHLYICPYADYDKRAKRAFSEPGHLVDDSINEKVYQARLEEYYKQPQLQGKVLMLQTNTMNVSMCIQRCMQYILQNLDRY